MNKLILASSSIYRQEILRKYYSDFQSISPEIDEMPLQNEKPIDLAMRLADRKAEKISNNFPNHYVIGSDQVASFNEQVLGKPRTYENALELCETINNSNTNALTPTCVCFHCRCCIICRTYCNAVIDSQNNRYI